MSAEEQKPFVSLGAAVLTISDSRTESTDTSGNLLVERLTDAGHKLRDRAIVRDDIYAIRATLSRWIADPQIEVVLCTGGTGVTGRDGTPEAVSVLLDKEIAGFGEMFRAISFANEIRAVPRKGNSVAAFRPFAGANRIRFKGLVGSTPTSQAVSDHPSVLLRLKCNLRRSQCPHSSSRGMSSARLQGRVR